jgi:ribosomal protein S18 acetylase RimI-like enzyme
MQYVNNKSMTNIRLFTSQEKPDTVVKNDITDFLFNHLEQYGDPIQDIEKSITYALNDSPTHGGFVLVSEDNNTITGAVVVNRTGMKGYIPENILVYIATHKDYRGKGIGKKLMEKALETAEGDVALHVEPDNPARFLYEKIGFASKYLEMRFKQN